MDSVPGRTPQWVTVDVENAETPGALDMQVEGTIPTWLQGCLYRNGAGIYDVKDTHIRHFFDGFSVLHKFSIQDGRVTFSSSLLDTSTLADALGIKRVVPTPKGPRTVLDPCKTIFKGSQSYFAQLPAERTDNTSVNIVEFNDELYALTETATINKIDPELLKRLEMIDLTKVISIHTGTAHPHFNTDGDMFSYGTNFDHRKAYNIVRIPRLTGQGQCDPMMNAEILASIPSRWQTNIAYNHSFGMSENYFVILDQPVAFNTKKFQISNVDMQGVAGTLVLRKGETLQFNVINRKTNKKLPMTYETNCAFVFHFVNCYEEDDYLIIDVIIYHLIDAIFMLYMDSMRKSDYQIPDPGSFARFVLPLNVENLPCDFNLVSLPNSKATAILEYDAKNTITLTPDFLMKEKITMELPRINYGMCAGRKYRYAYGTSVFSDYYRLVKVDTQERTYKEWRITQYYLPGEPIFVPNPCAIEEDDGVILSPVLCETLEEPSFLLILDAKTFTELARAYIPRDVKMSMTFHGSFCGSRSADREEPTMIDIHL